MAQKTCHSTANTLLFMNMQHPVINAQWHAEVGLPFFIHPVYFYTPCIHARIAGLRLAESMAEFVCDCLHSRTCGGGIQMDG